MGSQILIIDAHRMVATALSAALCGRGVDVHELRIGDVEEMLAAAGRYSGGVVLVDPDLGRDERGRQVPASRLVAGLTEQGKKALVIAKPDQAATAALIAAGAVGTLDKSASFEVLLETLGKAAAGSPVMTGAERARWLARHDQHEQRRRDLTRPLQRLSPRELQVLQALAAGHRAAAIAEQSTVTLATVRVQIKSILAKLEVSSQIEAVAMLFAARRAGREPR